MSDNKDKGARGYHKSEGSNKHMRLKSLDCFDVVLEMIRYGYSKSRISEYIQDEQDEYTDITKGSLSTILGRFIEDEFMNFEEDVDSDLSDREMLPPEDKEEEKKREEKSKAMDVISEYESLYRLQKDRIDRAIQVEEKSDKLMKGISKEVRVAAEILNNIGKYHQDLGIMPKSAEEINIGVSRRVDKKVEAEEVETKGIHEEPAKRNRVLKFLQAAEGIEDIEDDYIEAEFEKDVENDKD